MANRWMRPDGTPPDKAGEESTARGEGVLPPGAVESWRTWLLTGNPGVVSDRRRLRGSHRSLKQMLVDGTGQEVPQSWKHFSGAMVRLAINDALNALPKDQTHVVWLAYFAGLSNGQIARRLGISVGAVQHRCRAALACEHGQGDGQHGCARSDRRCSERATIAGPLAASLAAAAAVPASSSYSYSLSVAGVDHHSIDRRDRVIARRDKVCKHWIVRHRIRTEVTPVIGRGVDYQPRRMALQV